MTGPSAKKVHKWMRLFSCAYDARGCSWGDHSKSVISHSRLGLVLQHYIAVSFCQSHFYVNLLCRRLVCSYFRAVFGLDTPLYTATQDDQSYLLMVFLQILHTFQNNCEHIYCVPSQIQILFSNRVYNTIQNMTTTYKHEYYVCRI